MTIRRKSARYLATLVYIDEPYLLLLESGKSKVVAVAVEGEGTYPFFAALVSDRDWERYLRQSVDLRYLFIFSQLKSLYTFDLSNMKDNIILMNKWDSTELPEEYLPSPQFFARDHTDALPSEIISVSTQVFAVDGSWDLPDFSQFYTKYSDLYAFNISFDNLANDNVEHGSKRKIIEAFTKYPYRGGSSYRHFYKDLYQAQPANDQLGVKRIKYASPGHVDIIGREDVFNKIKSDIINYGSNYTSINAIHSDIRKFLSNADLLRVSSRNITISPEMHKTITQKYTNLAESLNVTHLPTIMDLCLNDSLAIAKVLMSYYRRIDQTYDFFAQGRVRFEDISHEQIVSVVRTTST